MSWQTYVDDHLMVDLPGGGMLQSAAIFGLDGVPWAQSASFPTVDPANLQLIANSFDDQGQVASNLKFGDNKYILIAGEPGAVIRGKLGQGGVTIKKTNSAMVIGFYTDGVQPGDCNVVVENLGDYLVGQGI
mmetsp:Transcript_25456/g.35072  ORF Transcript_25456/g.35072 Transcript_25456/m.35072 type:complete len:132 (-) Transcript_25456:388-783(-)|eukprot:CAMPEP_0196572770 /NCGR_PEP_ID=MMETSP1081-20130531/2759_1 /TAXON_ID=36882 /ORGANISM="Pyramimonas amylifera, Strain CCMP720" /LENGTH=131 /DNA_ID=CAMNT_0041890201 /DNA_START=95 /DNA_END=490 /DNA_ORIENTATION=-